MILYKFVFIPLEVCDQERFFYNRIHEELMQCKRYMDHRKPLKFTSYSLFVHMILLQMKQDVIKELGLPSRAITKHIQEYIPTFHEGTGSYSQFCDHFLNVFYRILTKTTSRISSHFLKFSHDNKVGDVVIQKESMYIIMYVGKLQPKLLPKFS